MSQQFTGSMNFCKYLNASRLCCCNLCSAFFTWNGMRKITVHTPIHIAWKCQKACVSMTKIIDQGKLFWQFDAGLLRKVCVKYIVNTVHANKTSLLKESSKFSVSAVCSQTPILLLLTFSPRIGTKFCLLSVILLKIRSSCSEGRHMEEALLVTFLA